MLDGKVVLISNFTAGLTARLAVEAAAIGAQVVVTQRPGEKLQAALESLAEHDLPKPVACFPADPRKTDECRWVVQQALAKFGQVDALIAGAGGELGVLGPVESADLNSWRALMEENFFAALTIIQEVLPHMKERRAGRIVTLNAVAARKPIAGYAGFAASKAALASVTGYLATECGRWGIGVNSVFLGWVWGSATADRFKNLAAEIGTTVAKLKADITEGIPVGYIPEESDCARAILLLLTDSAAVVTGASLDISGGEFIPL